MTAERVPCPDCGIGIIGRHMLRHTGSKACALRQKQMQFTRDLLSPLYQMAEKMEQVSREMRELAEVLKRG
jgi:hypothetical protein